MSNFLNDSLSKQIERGEVFYAGIVDTSVSEDEITNWAIRCGTRDCSLSLDMLVETTFRVSLVSGITYSSGTQVTLNNLNDASSNTIAAELKKSVSYSGGSSLWTSYLLNGKVSPTSPLSISGGTILAANTDYAIQIINRDIDIVVLNANFFLREL